MVELVRAGRTPGELAEEFERSDQTIRNRVAQADRDEVRPVCRAGHGTGRLGDCLATQERARRDRKATAKDVDSLPLVCY